VQAGSVLSGALHILSSLQFQNITGLLQILGSLLPSLVVFPVMFPHSRAFRMAQFTYFKQLLSTIYCTVSKITFCSAGLPVQRAHSVLEYVLNNSYSFQQWPMSSQSPFGFSRADPHINSAETETHANVCIFCIHLLYSDTSQYAYP